MRPVKLRVLAAVLLAAVSVAALAQAGPRLSGRPALASVTLSKRHGFIRPCGFCTSTITVTRSARPQLLADLQTLEPSVLPPSRKVVANPDVGSVSLVLRLRDGTVRTYTGAVPASLTRVVRRLEPLLPPFRHR